MYLFDLHCDTLTKCYDNRLSLKNNSLSVDFSRLSLYDKSVQVFAVFTENHENIEYVLKCIDYYSIHNYSELNHYGILSLENLAFIKNDLSLINLLNDKGVKISSLTWNDANQFGGGVDSINGLTRLGKEAVFVMQGLNITLDVSHLNDQTFCDVLQISDKPIIATHSNCRKVCNNKRNLTDEQILQIIRLKGLIGINLYPLFINGTDEIDYTDVLEHIYHILSLGGQDVISIGSDFDGCIMSSKFSDVASLKPFYFYLKNTFNTALADKIFYFNAYNFFKNTG